MTQKTKTILIYGGAILIGSGIAYAIYNANKTKLPLVDGARVTEDETPTPEGTKSNTFTPFATKPLPSSIGYTFGSTTKL